MKRNQMLAALLAFFFISFVSISISQARFDQCATKRSSSCCGSKKARVLRGACRGARGHSVRSGCCSHARGRMCARKRAAAVSSISSQIPYRESKRLILVGKYVCGKCNLEKLDFCQGYFRTSNGDLYPLISNEAALMMRNKVMHEEASASFEIVSRVRILDGVKYLEVERVKGD